MNGPRLSWDESLKARVTLLLIFVGAMWLIRAADSLLPRGMSVAGHGIIPRSMAGLSGIASGPFIHGDWQHLIANTLPLLVWGSLVLLRGAGEFIFVVLVSALASGLGTWLFGAPNTNHIGASGVALGLLGYLLFRSVFDRRLSSLLITLAVAVAYGTLLMWSLVPAGTSSWTGHFFGFVGGIIAARVRYPTLRRRDHRVDAALSALEVPRRPS